MKAVRSIALSSVIGLTVFVALVFVPAGTLHYWQGWVFIAVFTASTLYPTIYLLRTNPAAVERRTHAGPFAETRLIQQVIISVVFAAMLGMVIVSVLDHRFGWSSVPTGVCLLGDVLVAIGLGISELVVVQNGYAAANVTVEEGQSLVSTGLYGFVRHPMYTGAVILMLGVPLALGSYWGLMFVVVGLAVLVVRIRDEEAMLRQELAGYRDYLAQVRYRLLPYVW